jgi:5'-phosphate synthase pdxT subunit
LVKDKSNLEKVDAVVLPGGESTTISKNMVQSGLFDILKKRIDDNDIAVMGTCAGCVLLGSSLARPSEDIQLLEAMDIEVQRNAFGRQCESFEYPISFEPFSKPFPAVFIRAPAITKTGKNVQILSTINEKIIAARQGRFLALSFHPELTMDTRIHSYFIEML